MSKNRHKKPYSSAPVEEENLPLDEADDAPTAQNADAGGPAPESEPKPETVVVVQSPSQEKEIRVVLSEPKADPKAAKPTPDTERIGDLLRKARLKRGDDLYMIAEYLCIKPAFLIALENCRYDEFPADAYVIGFLRTYSNFLGIDGKEAVDRYRYEMAGRRKKPILSMPTPVSEGRIPSAIILVGAAVALMLIYSLWYSFSSVDRAQVRVAPPLPTAVQTATSPDMSAAAGLTAPVPSPAAAAQPQMTPVAPAPMTIAPEKSPEAALAPMPLIPPASPGIVVTAEKQAPAAAPPKAAAPEKAATNPKSEIKAEEKVIKSEEEDKKQPVSAEGDGAARVVIRATQNSWVMVADNSGKTIFDRVLKPGETYKVPNRPGLSLTTGNGTGIVISLDGKDLPKISNGAPHMIRNVPLDPNRLTSESGSSFR